MSDLTANKNSSFWAWFGKISAIIIAFSSIIIIIQFISSIGNKVKINYSFQLMKYHKSPERIKETLSSGYTINEITIADFILDKNEYKTEFNNFIKLDISNSGKQVAEGLIINFPFNGVYYLTYHDGTVKKGEFTRQIEIGSLKINEKCEILIWTKDFIFFSENIIYSHNNGTGKINFPLYIYNPLVKFIINNTVFSVFILILIIFVVLGVTFIVLNYFFYKKEYNNKNSENLLGNGQQDENVSDDHTEIIEI